MNAFKILDFFFKLIEHGLPWHESRVVAILSAPWRCSIGIEKNKYYKIINFDGNEHPY